jgi:hypothetical protein
MPVAKKPAAPKSSAAKPAARSAAKTAATESTDAGPAQVETKVVKVRSSAGGAVYGFGLIGSAVYYIQQSEGFGEFLVACLKAIVWPAFVVYDLLQHLGS